MGEACDADAVELDVVHPALDFNEGVARGEELVPGVFKLGIIMMILLLSSWKRGKPTLCAES